MRSNRARLDLGIDLGERDVSIVTNGLIPRGIPECPKVSLESYGSRGPIKLSKGSYILILGCHSQRTETAASMVRSRREELVHPNDALHALRICTVSAWVLHLGGDVNGTDELPVVAFSWKC